MADSEKRDKDVPLSTWNNNPGNLRPPKGVVYQGQIGIDPKGFAIFEDPDSGRAALINDINIKIKRGINTPDAFIDIYSPAGKENPDDSRKNYKSHIAKLVGINSPTDPFPQGSAEKIADAITDFEAGTWQDSKEQSNKANVRSEAPAEPTEPPPNVELDITGKPIDSTQANKDLSEEANAERTISNESGDTSTANASDAAKVLAGAVGAKTGLITSASIEAARQGIPLIPNAIRAARFLPPDPNSPTTRSSMQRYLTGQHHHNVHLADLEREFNNFLKSKDPAAKTRRLRTMSEVQEALDAIKPTKDQIVAKPRVEMVPGKPGVFRETGQVTSKLIPGSPGIDLEKYAPNPNTPIRNVATNAGKSVADFTKSVAPSLGRVGLGTLGGLSAGLSAVDAADYYQNVEKKGKQPLLDPRFYSKGAAAVGGGLMMIPYPATQIIGGLLSAPEMGLSAYEMYEANKGK
jgi:hypothetical protein